MTYDNARCGIRGVRATLTSGLEWMLHNEYGFPEVDNLRDIGGSSNLNAYFTCYQEPFVVRVYRQSVTPQRLGSIQAAREHLYAAGIPCTTPMVTCTGHKCAWLDSHLVEVERFIASTATMNSPDRVTTALPMMALVHSLMAELPEDKHGDQPLFANHVESREVVARTTNGINRVKAWDPTEPETEICTIAECLAQRVAAGEEEFLRGLRYQRAHGDFWDNNVLFGDGEIVLVADFDYMGRTARTDDLARTLYFAISSHCTGHNDHGELINYAASLVEAYNSTAVPQLTRLERLVLPLSIVRESLSWVANWLPDLDDQELARSGFGEGRSDLAMSQSVLDNLWSWQTSFTA